MPNSACSLPEQALFYLVQIFLPNYSHLAHIICANSTKFVALIFSMKNKGPKHDVAGVELFNVEQHENWLVGGNTERVPGKVKPVVNNVRLSWSR